jgi:hypothetical protein
MAFAGAKLTVPKAKNPALTAIDNFFHIIEVDIKQASVKLNVDKIGTFNCLWNRHKSAKFLGIAGYGKAVDSGKSR